MKRRNSFSLLAYCIVLGLYSTSPAAEVSGVDADEADSVGQAEERHVTPDQFTIVAEKREKPQQEVKAATSLITRDEIQDAGITTLEDLNGRTPNLHIQKAGGASESFISMRGIVAQRQVMSPSGIGVYIDGVNYLDPLSVLTYTDLMDLARVEVLRGPQGTLYGRNTEAGVLNILTRKPDGINRLYGELSIGNSGLQQYLLGGGANLIEDTLSFTASGMWMQRDGFVRNTYLNKDLTDLEQYFLRGRLRWTPRVETEVLLNLDGHKSDDGPQDLVFIPGGDQSQVTAHETDYDFFGKQTHDAKGVSLQWNEQFDGAMFTSISSLRNSKERTLGDADFTQYDLFVGDFNSDQDQYTQEFRLASDNDSPLQWLVGAYWFRLSNDFSLGNHVGWDAVDGVTIFAPMDIVSNGKFTNYGTALYGETTWTFDNGISLTGGLRWETETAKSDENATLSTMGTTMPYGAFNGKKSFNNWLPKFAIGYQAGDDLNFYSSIARGARSGGFNSVAQVPQGNSYDPEFSTNYEIGMKSTWFDKRMMLNLTLFQTDISDMQVSRRIVSGTLVTTNAGKARNRGAELEILAWPFESDFQIGASFGYVDAKYTDYTDPLAGTNSNDNRVSLVPKYTSGLSAQYRAPLVDNLDGFIRGEWQYVDKTYWDDANQYSESSYNLLNLRVGVESSNWQAYVWGKNLTDEKYVRTALPDSSLGGIAASYGDPRTYGITVRVEF